MISIKPMAQAKSGLAKLESDFFLRRLHSFSGMFPLGAFMVFHLVANSTASFGPEKFNAVINFLRSMPYLEELEIAVLFIPFAFHGLYGLVITRTANPNQDQYSHWENWKYVFQRITGVIGFFFIIFHVYQLRFVEDLDYNYVASALSSNVTLPFLPDMAISAYWVYIVGVVALIYHFAHGIWSFCITWGITVGKKSQDVVAWMSTGIFIVLTLMSVKTINDLVCAACCASHS